MASARRNNRRWAWLMGFILMAAAAMVCGWLMTGAPQAARCPPGLIALGARCCAAGQQLVSGSCKGRAETCSSAQRIEHGRCFVESRRVEIAAGRLELDVSDWDLGDRIAPPGPISVGAFAIDSAEVTWDEWQSCVSNAACVSIVHSDPELPVTGVSPKQSDAFCRWRGGQLPTSEQWLLAAAGAEGRRYPWGPFGLVCRRAVFGLEAGPCGQRARGPDMPGSRPDGATPDGILDMAGNVAEWTLDNDPPRYVTRGGSYRSTLASQLKVLGVTATEQPAADVGFRCVYPAGTGNAASRQRQ